MRFIEETMTMISTAQPMTAAEVPLGARDEFDREERRASGGSVVRDGGPMTTTATQPALTDELLATLKENKAELLDESHLCPGCAGEMALQDLARDVWWCPACRRWADGQGRPLPGTETPKPVARDEEEARKLIADLKAAGCAFAYEDGELRLRYPSRMSAGLWARFERAGHVFRVMAREAAVCEESVDDL